MSVVVAMLTAPVNLLVDFIFEEILSAPTADSLKQVQLMTARASGVRRVARTANAAVRRMSAATLSTLRTARGTVRDTLFKKPELKETRLIPSGVIQSQASARFAAENLLVDAQDRYRLIDSERESQRQHVMSVRGQRSLVREKYSARSAESSAESMDSIRVPVSLLSVPSEKEESWNVDDKFAEFEADLWDQRKALKIHEKDSFDMKWGIDPTGSFFTGRNSFRRGPVITFGINKLRDGSAQGILKMELKEVHEQTKSKIDKLKMATKYHTGNHMLACMLYMFNNGI